jgi:hypothetical protein
VWVYRSEIYVGAQKLAIQEFPREAAFRVLEHEHAKTGIERRVNLIRFRSLPFATSKIFDPSRTATDFMTPCMELGG